MAGTLGFAELKRAVTAGTIDTVVVAMVDMQGRLIGKRFHADYFVEAAHRETHACDYLLANDIDMEPVPGYAAASWDKGYGDFVLRPDLSTLRRLPWLEGTALVLADVEVDVRRLLLGHFVSEELADGLDRHYLYAAAGRDEEAFRAELAVDEVLESMAQLRKRAQRLGALEATALLRRVMEEIDVAIFAFDSAHALRLVNRSGAALLGRAPEQLLGRDAASLGLASCLADDTPRVDSLTFPGRAGRWEVRRGTFRQGGLPHQLLVLTDVSRALSDEERQAWKRLIRVLSHELNNSLAPIKSIADSLLALIMREPAPPDQRQCGQRRRASPDR